MPTRKCLGVCQFEAYNRLKFDINPYTFSLEAFSQKPQGVAPRLAASYPYLTPRIRTPNVESIHIKVKGMSTQHIASHARQLRKFFHST